MDISPKVILGALAVGALWWATKKPAAAAVRYVTSPAASAPTVSGPLMQYNVMSQQARANVNTPVGGSFFSQALAAYAGLGLNEQVYMRGDLENLKALYGAVS